MPTQPGMRAVRGGRDVDVDIDRSRFKRSLERYLRKRLERGLNDIVDAAIRKISRTQPVHVTSGGNVVGLAPSRPGEPPKVLTGRLRSSMTSATWRSSHLGWPIVHGRFGITADVPYAMALEFGRPGNAGNNPPPLAPRPYLRPTYYENRKMLLKKLG